MKLVHLSKRFINSHTMDNITALENSTKHLQMLGLQGFSLNSLSDKKHKKFPSIWYSVYLVVLLAYLIASLTIVTIKNYEEDKESLSENNLNFIMKTFLTACLTTLVIVSILVTFFKHRQMLKFFRNSEKISELCFHEFKFRMNFGKLKCDLIKFNIFCGVFFIITTLVVIMHHHKHNAHLSKHKLSHRVLHDVPAFFVLTAVAKFAFHVHIVNFHLKVLKKLIKDNFANNLNHQKFESVSIVYNVSSKTNPKRTILVFRKIFALIEEMSSHVDETMGFVVLITLLFSITGIIRFGYRLFMILIGSSDATRTRGEAIIRLNFLN